MIAKHESTDSYFYLVRQLAKCMMRDDALNLHVYPVRTQRTSMKHIPTSHVCSTYESELKEFLVDETRSQICYTDEDESKGIIVENYSTEEYESECVQKNINKQKDAYNEAEYEESSVIDEEPRYFNIFECGRNILNIIDVKHEQAYIATTKEKYYTKMLETLGDYNDRNNAPLSNKKLRKAVGKVMAEMEEEQRDAKRNANNVTMDTFCHQSPVTTNTQGKIENLKNER